MPAKKKSRSQIAAEEVLLALWRGERHDRRDCVIAPLCRAALIRVVETTALGSAKRCELTESGVMVARLLASKTLVMDAPKKRSKKVR